MADNITLNQTAASTIKTIESTAGYHYQQNLLAYGVGATQTDVTSTSGLPTALPVCTVVSYVFTADQNSTLVKASAGVLYGYSLFSIANTTVYLKLYNKATAPTVGTDTPLFRAGVTDPGGVLGVHVSEFFPNGLTFDTGIGFGAVAALVDSDTTALTVSEGYINLYYV